MLVLLDSGVRDRSGSATPYGARAQVALRVLDDTTRVQVSV